MKTNEELYRDFMSRFDAKNPPHMRDAFVAGMEAARPRWHDLRKDPNDLPPIDEDYGYSNTTLVASYYGKVFSAYYDVESETWWGGGDTDYRKNEIVAWMPLPEWKGGSKC